VKQLYKIIRFKASQKAKNRVIKRNLTLFEAQKHCNDPKSREQGKWFDGYTKQTMPKTS
jgi:hypothetical protein